MNPQDIARELTKARKMMGVSQKEAAERMGCHVSFIQRIEKGEGDRQISQLFRYADAIGVTLGFYIEKRH